MTRHIQSDTYNEAAIFTGTLLSTFAAAAAGTGDIHIGAVWWPAVAAVAALIDGRRLLCVCSDWWLFGVTAAAAAAKVIPETSLMTLSTGDNPDCSGDMLEHADKMLASKQTDKVKVKVDIRRTFFSFHC